MYGACVQTGWRPRTSGAKRIPLTHGRKLGRNDGGRAFLDRCLLTMATGAYDHHRQEQAGSHLQNMDSPVSRLDN